MIQEQEQKQPRMSFEEIWSGIGDLAALKARKKPIILRQTKRLYSSGIDSLKSQIYGVEELIGEEMAKLEQADLTKLVELFFELTDLEKSLQILEGLYEVLFGSKLSQE